MLPAEPQDALFRDFKKETLDSDPAVIYAVDKEWTLIFANTAWDRFAASNRGRHLTREKLNRVCILDGLAGPLRSFYRALFSHVRNARVPFEHEFECSSDEVYRELRMRVIPLESSGGLLIANSLVTERPQRMPASAFDTASHLDAEGLITMCSSCRRTRNVSQRRWDWVPDLIGRMPPEVTHSLCGLCLERYYVLKRVLKAARA